MVFFRKYEIYKKLVSAILNRRGISYIDNGLFKYKNPSSEVLYFPVRQHYQLFNIYINGYLKHLNKKYFALYDEYLIDKGAIEYIIDCGAFVGGFSLAAAKRQFADNLKIYAIEPTSKTFECLAKNTSEFPNIEQCKMALGLENDTLELKHSSTFTDNSLFEDVENQIGSSEFVDVVCLKDFIEERKIDVDKLYLKVEAEGYEPEVIGGLKDLRPRFIIVDISPERGGVSCKTDIIEMLKESYHTVSNKKTLLLIRK